MQKNIVRKSLVLGMIMLFVGVGVTIIPYTFLKTSKANPDNVILSDDEQPIVDRVLRKEGVNLADFEIEIEAGNFFKTRAR